MWADRRGGRVRTIVAVALAAAVAVPLWAAAAGATSSVGSFETLDGNSAVGGRISGDVGQWSSTVVLAGVTHTFSRDATHGTLRHAWWNGSSWSFETLDGSAAGSQGQVADDVGTDVRATVGGPDQIDVYYYDVTTGDLRHAAYAGAAWTFETLDGNASGPRGQVNEDLGTDISTTTSNGTSHVFYYDVTTGDLRHAWFDGANWSFETLDGSAAGGQGQVAADVGQYSAATTSNGQPQVFYYDDTDTTLRHASFNGTSWTFEVLDGVGGANGRVNESVGSDIAVGSVPSQIDAYYYDISAHSLRHAAYNGTTWSFETLDGSGAPAGSGRVGDDVGQYAAVSSSGGATHLFYYDATAGDLRLATRAGSAGWSFETVDGAGGSAGQLNANVGTDISTIAGATGTQVWYYDVDDHDLRHATLSTWGAWDAPLPFPAADGSAAAVAATGPNRLDAFARGSDGSLRHTFWTGSGSWAGWQSLGGVTLGAPAATWSGANLVAFARGSDNQLWEQRWNGSTWTGWVPLGGILASGPAVAARPGGLLDVFVRGLNGLTWRRAFDGSTWHPWSTIGGVTTDAPAAVGTDATHVSVFVRGSDGGVWTSSMSGTTWSGFSAIPGRLVGSPAVSSWGANRLDLFVRGTDNQLWHAVSTGGTWGSWDAVGGSLTAPPASASWAPSRLDVLVRGGDNRMWHRAAT